jgi:hypothetical protein
LLKTSGNGVYGLIARKFANALTQTVEQKIPGPIVIVDLVRKAITAKKPKTRYHGGYMAGIALFMRKLLSDRLFDKLCKVNSNNYGIFNCQMKDDGHISLNNLLYSCVANKQRGNEQFNFFI